MMFYAGFLIAPYVLLPAAGLVGYRLGRRIAARQDQDQGRKSHVVTLQAALLALAGLLIGFTFSMAEGRYQARKLIVVAEANAIGTAYLRTRLLEEGPGEQLRVLLRRYVDVRLAFSEEGLDRDAIAQTNRQSAELEDQIWSRASAAALTDPHPAMASLFVRATNEMIDAAGAHVAAVENPLPVTVFLVLILVIAVAMGSIGYHCGLESRIRLLGMLVLPVLLATVIALEFDLANPRVGIVRVHNSLLLRLKQSF